MQKRSKLQAIIDCKCPRCRKGDIFSHSIKKISKFSETNKNCPVCKVRFEPEPGFFFGAMYISYAFIVGILLVTGFLIHLIFEDPQTIVYVVAVPTVVILTLPLIFRYSRSIYLHLVGGISYSEKFS